MPRSHGSGRLWMVMGVVMSPRKKEAPSSVTSSNDPN